MNKLLQRQIQKHFGTEIEVSPDKVKSFIQDIQESYEHYEKDRTMLERSIELSSDEMIHLNDKLRKESNESKIAHYELKLLLDNIEDVFFTHDVKHNKFLQFSTACLKVYGHKQEKFYENPNLWFEVILEEDKQIMSESYFSLLAGKPYTSQYRIHHADNTIHWLETRVTPTLNENGTLIRVDGVSSDITERKLSEETLLMQNSELTKTNSELDKFVYSVSHDLRAPLSSMLGVIEISMDETKEELIIEHLGMLKGSIKKLDGFILDILNYSRNSRLEVQKEEIDFREIINDITNNLKHMENNNRKMNVCVEVNNDAAFCSDKSRLTIILNNLVSNAFRYQNPDASEPFVNIKVDTSDTETNIIVRDNGIGIDNENIEKIFDMFYRVSESSVGSGLGLYIVKEAINKLNGDIKVISTQGVGTIFNLHIPNASKN